MRRLYARLPVRGLSLAVFAVLLGGSLTASGFARRVTADQERRMLERRAGEAAALLTNQITQSQASTRALAAVVLATDGDPEIFREAARRDPAIANGTAGIGSSPPLDPASSPERSCATPPATPSAAPGTPRSS